MRPTEVLSVEHRVIERVLSCLELMVRRGPGHFDPNLAEQALDFFRSYADRFHHAKEEDLLFPALERRGFSSEEGPTRVMRDEHALGRQHIQAMANAVLDWRADKREAFEPFAREALLYLELLRGHIYKEDHCLFPMAEQALGEDAQTELSAAFLKVEQESLGLEMQARCIALADQLCEQLGVVNPRLTEAPCCSAPAHKSAPAGNQLPTATG